jgi:PAS domain-containing protein
VDVTEARKALEEARRKSTRLENVLDSICHAIVLADAVGLIYSVNPAAEALLG